MKTTDSNPVREAEKGEEMTQEVKAGQTWDEGDDNDPQIEI